MNDKHGHHKTPNFYFYKHGYKAITRHPISTSTNMDTWPSQDTNFYFYKHGYMTITRHPISTSTNMDTWPSQDTRFLLLIFQLRPQILLNPLDIIQIEALYHCKRFLSGVKLGINTNPRGRGFKPFPFLHHH